jgi:ribonuclease-3
MTISSFSFLRKIKTTLFGPAKDRVEAASLPRLESLLGYRFTDRSLLVGSLRHRSYSVENPAGWNGDASNERMEFLGDAVLSLVVNEYLYRHYTEKREGELTKMKSVIVSKAILSHFAKRHGLGGFILLSEHAQKAGVDETDSVLADTFEAIFGAVFLDGGFEAARGCVRRLLLSDVRGIFSIEENINYKSLLQEYIQALHKVPPRYRVSSTTGPEHQKVFVVEVSVQGRVIATGTGKSKKVAEQEAARTAYKRLLNADGITEEP